MNNSTTQILDTLQKIFDLPDRLIELNLKLSLDYPPELTITYLPNLKNNNIETKKFEIKEIE